MPLPHESPRRQWFGARDGDGDGRAPSPPRPNLTVAHHLRARNLPPPLRAAAADHQPSRRQGSTRLLRQEPNFLGARGARGERRDDAHSGAAGPMGSGE